MNDTVVTIFASLIILLSSSGIRVSADPIGMAITDSNRMILQPVLKKCEVYGYVALPVRVHPLVIKKIIDESETYRYTLPDQYEKQEIKRTRVLNNRFGSCRVVISKKSGSPVLEVKKEIHVRAMVIKPIDYDEFVRFCLELKRIENDTVILKK